MTATAIRTIDTTTTGTPTEGRSLWRTGAVVGLTAAAATFAVAGIASAAGVSLETAPGEAIPLVGFPQLTLFFTVIGVLLARTINRRAARPRSIFTRTTVALTALSLVPDIALSTDSATKLTLMATHVVAAAIVIPALAARLATSRAA